jgi:plasmid stabilization system protein ParE
LTKSASDMAYRVELTDRADRDLRSIYRRIHADDSWAVTPEDENLRHLLYGSKPHAYRIVYCVYERAKKVRVLHIRHGARKAFKWRGAR